MYTREERVIKSDDLETEVTELLKLYRRDLAEGKVKFEERPPEQKNQRGQGQKKV